MCVLQYELHTQQYNDVLVKKRAAEVGEVVGAAFNQGVAHHFEITGGILPGNREIGILETYLEAFRETTGFDHLPGSAIMTPPDHLDDLERLKRTGLHGVGFNLECFDPAFFKAVCLAKKSSSATKSIAKLSVLLSIFSELEEKCFPGLSPELNLWSFSLKESKNSPKRCRQRTNGLESLVGKAIPQASSTSGRVVCRNVREGFFHYGQAYEARCRCS